MVPWYSKPSQGGTLAVLPCAQWSKVLVFTTNCYNSLIAVMDPVTEPLRYYVHVGDHIGRRSGGSRLRRIRGKRARNADGDDRSAGERAAEWQKWTR